MTKSEAERLGARAFDACMATAAAALALYGAVWLLSQIWVWLVAIGVVVGFVAVGRWWWERW